MVFAYFVPETNVLGLNDMARDLPDTFDIEPTEMSAIAQEMIRNCSEHLHTCREISSSMSVTMSNTRPEIADRFQAIRFRVEDKILRNEKMQTG